MASLSSCGLTTPSACLDGGAPMPTSFEAFDRGGGGCPLRRRAARRLFVEIFVHALLRPSPTL
jgi:hypothetical protein